MCFSISQTLAHLLMQGFWHPAILKILLRDETLASEVDLTALARRTESFSGSDLKRGFLPLSQYPEGN